MKRDSKQWEDFREKPVGARLYLRIAEPVLELCTDREEGYTGSAHYSVRVYDMYNRLMVGRGIYCEDRKKVIQECKNPIAKRF